MRLFSATHSTPLLTVLLLAVVMPAGAAELRCTFQSRQICDPRGCLPGDPSTAFVTLRLKERQYGRCRGTRACDWYPMRVQRGGDYLHLDFSDGVQGAKMSLDGSLFIETVSLMDKVWVSFGRCER